MSRTLREQIRGCSAVRHTTSPGSTFRLSAESPGKHIIVLDPPGTLAISDPPPHVVWLDHAGTWNELEPVEPGIFSIGQLPVAVARVEPAFLRMWILRGEPKFTFVAAVSLAEEDVADAAAKIAFPGKSRSRSVEIPFVAAQDSVGSLSAEIVGDPSYAFVREKGKSANDDVLVFKFTADKPGDKFALTLTTPDGEAHPFNFDQGKFVPATNLSSIVALPIIVTTGEEEYTGTHFSRIMFGMHGKTEVAVKRALTPDGLDQLVWEATVLSKLKHNHIINVIGRSNCGKGLVLPRATGTLEDKIKAGVTKDNAVRLIEQLANALAFVHEQGLAHRDIKPDKFLIDGDDNVLLADFGICMGDGDQWSGCPNRAADAGTLAWKAMEIVCPSTRFICNYTVAHAQQCDVWAFGLCAALMLSSKKALPWSDVKNGPELQTFLSETDGLNATSLFTFSPVFPVLFSKCLDLDAAKRPTMADIVQRFRDLVDVATAKTT